MPKPWTSKLIIKALGVQKCNGSMDAAVEDLPLEKAMEVAREKAGLGHLPNDHRPSHASTRRSQ